jgi:sortase A
MSKRHPIPLLLIFAGAILLFAGGMNLLPTSGVASKAVFESLPADFGADALPARPTVTPSQFATRITTEPVFLPDSSSQVPKASMSKVPIRKPTPVSLAGSIPARLVIPAIKLDAPIETVGWYLADGISQWDVPDHFAVGWLMTSATLGKRGNTVFTGHHNIEGEVFRDLVKLKLGDRITVYSNDQSFEYEITMRKILLERGQSEDVRRANARWIQPTTDERITLITCWPYTSNTHRLIIVAKPLGPEKTNRSIAP